MTKKDFNAKVSEMCAYVKQHEYDNMSDELIRRNIRDPFTYGAWCEKNFEANLREDYKRKTTYTSDFSIAEWFDEDNNQHDKAIQYYYDYVD